MKRIGIDIGTTTLSGVVLDGADGKLLRSSATAHGAFISTPNSWERIQDTRILFARAKETLDALLERYPDTGAIGLTGQMHGLVYTDADGAAIGPLYTWQDGRANLIEDGMTLTERVAAGYGVTVPTGYGLMTHLYQRRHGQVPEAAHSLCTAADAFGMLLTGRKRPLVHVSNAASLGFFDAKTMRFRADVLSALGVPLETLPEITEDFAVIGSYCGIPVTCAIGDNQAAFLGSAGRESGTVLVNMGTGGQISVLSEQYFEAPGIEPRPIFPGHYLLSGSSLCGGRAYAILEKFLRGIANAAGADVKDMYAVMAGLAGQGEKETDRMRVSTLFNGTRQDPGLRGSVTNLSENNFTPGGMVYACLEGMADELHKLYKQTGMPGGARLVGSGNGIRRNPMLRKILSGMFGAELELARYEEEAAAGAAIFAKTE